MDDSEWHIKHKELRNLWMRFDPSGQMMPSDEDDEYENYVNETMSLLEQEASSGEMMGFMRTVYENMGLEFNEQAETRAGDFVRKLRDWYDRQDG